MKSKANFATSLLNLVNSKTFVLKGFLYHDAACYVILKQIKIVLKLGETIVWELFHHGGDMTLCYLQWLGNRGTMEHVPSQFFPAATGMPFFSVKGPF